MDVLYNKVYIDLRTIKYMVSGMVQISIYVV